MMREVGHLDGLAVAASVFLSLDLLAAWLLVTPHFRDMYEPFDCCLPHLTEVVLSWWFPGATVASGLLLTAVAILRIRSEKWRRAVLASITLVLLVAIAAYFLGLYLPIVPLA